jgi:hypothetical protein
MLQHTKGGPPTWGLGWGFNPQRVNKNVTHGIGPEWAVVNIVMNLEAPQRAANFVNS